MSRARDARPQANDAWELEEEEERERQNEVRWQHFEREMPAGEKCQERLQTERMIANRAEKERIEKEYGRAVFVIFESSSNLRTFFFFFFFPSSSFFLLPPLLLLSRAPFPPFGCVCVCALGDSDRYGFILSCGLFHVRGEP